MGDRIPEENIPQADGTADRAETGRAARTGKITKRTLTSRGILLIGIGGLLTALLIVGAVAWYTRINVVNQVTMDAAGYDFRANYTGGSFIIQADDYTTLYGEHKAAPGTAGVIPVLVQAADSQVDVDYSIGVDTSNMSDSFKKRIRFFYIPSNTSAGYQYAEKDEKDLTGVNDVIRGTLKGSTEGNGEERYEYIYWEWVYDLNDSRFYDLNNSKWYRKADETVSETERKNRFSELYPAESLASESEAFDLFDTEVSRGTYDATLSDYCGGTLKEYASKSDTIYWVDPVTRTYTEHSDVTLKAYQSAMGCRLTVTGVMATPVYNRDPGEEPVPSEDAGSMYVDLKDVINAHRTSDQ